MVWFYITITVEVIAITNTNLECNEKFFCRKLQPCDNEFSYIHSYDFAIHIRSLQ